MATQTPHNTHWNESRRLAGPNFTCVFCSQRFNEGDLKYQDDLENLPACPFCFEPNGGELARQLKRAEATELAAILTAKEAENVPEKSGWFDSATATCISAFSSRPLSLTRGGSAAALTLTGIFTADDTFTYGGSGITDAVAVAITDEDDDGVLDQAVLTLQASGGATVGIQSLTHNEEVYKLVLDVR